MSLRKAATIFGIVFLLVGIAGYIDPLTPDGRLFGLFAVDNEHKLKEAFHNHQGFVPAYYLFDREGKLRSFAAGERGLDMLKTALERVLTAEVTAVSV